MVNNAISHLLDKDILIITEIMQSDENMQYYGLVDRYLKMPENKYSQTDHHLCKLHKVVYCIINLFFMH